MNLKVAIFSGTDVRYYGGAQKYIIELCRLLSDYELTVFSYRDDKSARLNDEEVNKLLNAKLIYYSNRLHLLKLCLGSIATIVCT